MEDEVLPCRLLFYPFGKSGKEYRESQYARVILYPECKTNVSSLKKSIRYAMYILVLSQKMHGLGKAKLIYCFALQPKMLYARCVLFNTLTAAQKSSFIPQCGPISIFFLFIYFTIYSSSAIANIHTSAVRITYIIVVNTHSNNAENENIRDRHFPV